MKTERKSKSHIAIFVLCSILLFLFLYKSTASSEQLFLGLRLCAETLIPTLFPYMVISEMLVHSGVAEFISPVIEKVTLKLFGISGAGGAAIILGFLCGFPVGAKTTANLYEKGVITKAEAEKLMGICNLPSPPFVIFAVGEKLFGDISIGLFLYLNILAVTLILGMIKDKSSLPCSVNAVNTPQKTIFSVFTDSVSSAAGAVIKVCAYVAFFSAVIGGMTSFFDSASPILKAVVFSFFELTSGASACSALAERGVGLVIASAAIGWSGLSVFCQISSISQTKQGSISLRFYLSSKIISSVLCASITAIFLKIFPLYTLPAPSAEDAVSLIVLYSPTFISAINIIFIISLFIYLTKNLDRCRII